jgi:pyruvate dehydrogenase E2 component (dihydrolipoamide acetyltransferase)
MSTPTEVRVPDIGDFRAVPIIEVHVSTGDKVNAEDPLLTLESDKATLDVSAPTAGTIGEVLVKVGDEVSEGTPILMLSSVDGASTEPPTLVEQQEPAAGGAAQPVAEAVGVPTAGPDRFQRRSRAHLRPFEIRTCDMTRTLVNNVLNIVTGGVGNADHCARL